VMIWSYHAQHIAQSPRACVHDAHAPLIAQFQESLRVVSRGGQARVFQRQRQRQPAGRHTTTPDCPGCALPTTLQAHHASHARWRTNSRALFTLPTNKGRRGTAPWRSSTGLGAKASIAAGPHASASSGRTNCWTHRAHGLQSCKCCN
jgi:hypothetical protein